MTLEKVQNIVETAVKEVQSSTLASRIPARTVQQQPMNNLARKAARCKDAVARTVFRRQAKIAVRNKVKIELMPKVKRRKGNFKEIVYRRILT